MKIALVSILLLSVSAFAVVKKGEPAPNLCFTDETANSICLAEQKDTVQLLIYTTGWCPACKDLMTNLVPKLKAYADKPVSPLVLVVDGFTKGSGVTPEILTQYKTKYAFEGKIAASPKNAGKEFVEPPYYIPLVVILAKDGTVSETLVGPEADEVTEALDKAL